MYKPSKMYSSAVRILVVLLILGVLNVPVSRGQNLSAGTVVQTMQSIYKNYDSIPFLSFDVRYSYGSDTLLGDFTHEQLAGYYTMAGKKALYKLGDIDFMQNDSFFIAVYNNDKIILVDVPKTKGAGGQLPLRQMMDSMAQSYTSHFSVYNSVSGTDTNTINFDRTDTAIQLQKFAISYDNRNKLISRIVYEYSEPAIVDATVSSFITPPNRKRRLMIEFLNYRFDHYDQSLYSESNYIYFENGICKPVPKYDGYKIYYSRPVKDAD